jgi:RNA polymerase sigma-70 factor, ECF subfamily
MPETRSTETARRQSLGEPHSQIPTALAQQLFRKAEVPQEWGLTAERLAQALARSAARRFRDAASSRASVAAYLSSLHLADLALACACSDGCEAAWELFVRNFRPELYRAARAIAGESRGRELADSLYAELYGLEERGGRRRSLLDYFHGRSKLGTWLRAVLAQRHVDELRRMRQTDSLDDTPDREGSRRRELPSADPPPDPEREQYLAMLQAALTEALAALAPRDRLRLSYYYVQELTLAQIGRLLGEHEATASRKIERTRRDVRRQVDTALREKRRLSEAQLLLCYEYAQQEWPFDLTQALSTRE